jgi:site-specific DNA-cytosine methylase
MADEIASLRAGSVKPLAIDLFCGLGGWTDGLLAEGYDVIGFDIERHVYGEHCYPAQLVVQDVLTLHGSQFKTADLIVASPPCQEYSYMAMPWSRAKAKAAAIRADHAGAELARLTALFDACFRIQREACEAAGRHIPMVVENVKGAQPWVGRARWSFGSFYLWGDVPALMPPVYKGTKVAGFRFDGNGGSFQTAAVKNTGGSWFNVAHNTTSGRGQNPDGRKRKDADGYERSHPDAFGWKGLKTSSGSSARKMASAMIAKIPLPLSRYIAATFRPAIAEAAE